MLVTTTYDPAEEAVRTAKGLAVEFSARWVPRRRMSLPQLTEKFGDDEFLVVSKEGLKWIRGGQAPFFFHPSTAQVRAKRWLRGETDILLKVADVQPGDHVLDCTAGLASDAIIFALGVGAEGSVTAIESQRMLAFITRVGLAVYKSDVPELNRAMRAVRLEHADHLEYLKRLPDRSVDIVYLDPMFRHPIEESAAISALRGAANNHPVREETIGEARRVGRKTIVLKEHRNSREFVRLGFREIHKSGAKIAYGVIRL